MPPTGLGLLLACILVQPDGPRSDADLEASPPEAAADDEAPLSPIRFVLANTYGLGFGLAPIPSGEAALFLGGSLPVRLWHSAHWIALGYQGGITVGSADVRGFAAPASLIVHRHTLAVLGAAGPRGRLAYGVGVGLSFPVPPWSQPGLDAEARLGYMFGRTGRRNRGIVGAQLRVSGSIEVGPWPQVGVFVGFVHPPFVTGPSPVPKTPPNGLGLLVPGALLTASGLFTTISSGIAVAADGREGTLSLWSLTAPYAALAIAAGIPMLAVGSVRHHRHRMYRMRLGAGLRVEF